MFQTQFPQHPPQYYPPDYSSSPHTSRYHVYSPRQFIFSSSPTSKGGHARRATQDYGYTFTTTTSTNKHNTTTTTNTTTPKKATYYSSAESPAYHQSSQRKTDYVSDHDRKRATARKHASSPPTSAPHKSSAAKASPDDAPRFHYTSRTTYVYDDVEPDYECLPRYEPFPAHPPPYQRQRKRHERPTDHIRYAQVPIYSPADHTATAKPRPRRSSYSTKPTYTTNTTPSRPRPATANKTPRKATEEDARIHHIPAGYSYKNWNPDEEPILLLGSVFDANSLGKWIYDWTVFFYGPSHPISEIAGELWLLLIQLAGKVKGAEDVLGRVRQQANRDMVEEFLDSGERLWQRFNTLLKICENFMWKAAKREAGGAKHVTMGKTSGGEFVDSIFGRDRELERTEKLMTAIRLWSLRYTANVDPILADPAM